jgi:hypothetical protein
MPETSGVGSPLSMPTVGSAMCSALDPLPCALNSSLKLKIQNNKQTFPQADLILFYQVSFSPGKHIMHRNNL